MSDNLVKRLQENGDLLRHVEAQAARIAELEAALEDMAKHVWRGDWDKLKPETQKALKK